MSDVRGEAVNRSDRRSFAGKGISYDASGTGVVFEGLKTAQKPEPLEQRGQRELWVKLKDCAGPFKLLQCFCFLFCKRQEVAELKSNMVRVEVLLRHPGCGCSGENRPRWSWVGSLRKQADGATAAGCLSRW